MLTAEYIGDARDIPGFPGYLVNSEGKVFSKWKKVGSAKGKILDTIQREMRHGFSGGGYCIFNLNVDGKPKMTSAHQLVMLAFNGQCPDKMQVCHNDGDKSNNRLENLRYGTPKENQADRVLHGTSDRGERQWQAKLTEEKVLEIRNRHSNGEMQYVLAKEFCVSRAVVCRIVNRKSWSWLMDKKSPEGESQCRNNSSLPAKTGCSS